MHTVMFNFDLLSLDYKYPREIAARDYVLSLFHEESDPNQITLRGFIPFHYDDEGDMEPSFRLEFADLTEIFAPGHTVETGLINVPIISFAAKHIDVKDLAKEHVLTLETMLDHHYNKHFDDFKELLDQDNGDYD